MKPDRKSERVIMNFSGIYDGLLSDEVLSFRDMTGTDGYCSDEAKEEIRGRIQHLSASGIHYLDFGNYHYLSELWLEKVEGPFQLAMFDHHTDMQPSALLPLTSCGNWLLESLDENRNLQKVWLIGPPESSFLELSETDRNRVIFFDEKRSDTEEIGQLMGDFDPDLPVYLSVDKDILAETVLSTNWDQGSMTLERLAQWINWFSCHGTVIGMDLCGEESGQDSMQVNLILEQALMREWVSMSPRLHKS